MRHVPSTTPSSFCPQSPSPNAPPPLGRWVDNVFVERLWRSVKYEEVYLHAYEGVAAARVGLGRYFRFYNAERRHQGLGRRTPDAVYADIDSWPKAT